MPEANCAFYGCHTSRKSQILLFKIPIVCAVDSEHTKDMKTKARNECSKIFTKSLHEEVRPPYFLLAMKEFAGPIDFML